NYRQFEEKMRSRICTAPKALAELVFGDEDRLRVFDMTEYRSEESGNRLTGAPPSYVGYGEGGQLTNHVLAEPFSIILFDEIEKAHQSVNEKFMGILEEGRLTDGQGKTAYFDQCMLVFTSNMGADRLVARLEAQPDQQPSYDELRAIFMEAVDEHFTKKWGRPELRARYGDNIIVFDMLRPELVGHICCKFLDQLCDNAQRRRQLELRIDRDSIITYFTRRMREPRNQAEGGRRVRELIKTAVVRPLNDYLFAQKPALGSRLHLSIPGGDERISIRRSD
ncbi:MAG: AAA family ATPase, partial [Phycisphaeraceae bacterium]